MAGIIQYVIGAGIAFISYNEFVMMHRPGVFNDILKGRTAADITEALGEQKYVYQCGSGAAPPLYPYIDNICIEKVVEVRAYSICYIAPRCPGWYYVGFDQNGKVVDKYLMGN